MREDFLVNIFNEYFNVESGVSKCVLDTLLEGYLLRVKIILESKDVLVFIGKVGVDIPFTGFEAFEALILGKPIL